MAARQEQKLIAGVGPFLESGEQALAAIVTQPRGYSQTVTSRGMGGGGKLAKAQGQSQGAGVEVAAPMGLIVTDRRVLTLKISTAIGMGLGGSVKSVMSSIPLADVDGIEARRNKIAKSIVLTVRGNAINLESNIGANAEELARRFLEAKRQSQGD
jgi:hypothetical protein